MNWFDKWLFTRIVNKYIYNNSFSTECIIVQMYTIIYKAALYTFTEDNKLTLDICLKDHFTQVLKDN